MNAAVARLDFKETRVAVGRKNGTLEVWEKGQKWEKSAEWKATAASLAWAKPCFGSMLASSSGNQVTVWNGEGREIARFCVMKSVRLLEFGVHEDFLELAVCQENSTISFCRPKDELNADKWYFSAVQIGLSTTP
eukprot:TRINITY_DN2661_c0_g4_i2.p2 TRINITY_DN2661_c0_g4~~TRINITY_DN2661_c0_g4_i2.p2  ORF type:complete len:135 (-),score=25.19 TRINITY_DN2661_c0_g4_i2:533-937(-)